MNSFNIARVPEFFFGEGMLKELPGLNKLFGRNILIVTGGKSLKKSGYYKQIIESLKDFNVYVVNVDSEPSPVIIDTFVLNNLNNNIDVVCAIGGGSALDTGKAVSAMLKEEKFRTVKDYLEGVGSREPSGNKIPFIAVPTTSGTGSEATKNAVISEIGPAGFKKSLRHDNYIPNAAVIDPQLTVKCPATITAASGLDALSQLLESYISTKANAFTDSLAVKAIPGMLNSLNEVCSREPENIEKRGSVAYSSFISGITLANAGLCTVHGLAGVIGGYKNIPHGTICGLLLPYWLEETVAALLSDCGKYRKYLDKLSAIVNVTGFNFKNNEDIERIQNFVMQVKQLAEDLDLPKLNTFGVTEGDLNSFAKEGSNKNNPVKLTAKQKLKILKKAF